MKLLFLSDIHGSLPAVEAVFAAAGATEPGTPGAPDMVVLLGDVMYHGPRNPLPAGYDPRATASFLNRWKDRIVAVRGNCDAEVDQMLLEFPARADFSWLTLDGTRLFLTHGHLWGEASLPPLSPGDVFVYGHTHIPRAHPLGQGAVWNPGSCSLPKEGYEASFGLYENGVFRVRTLEGRTALEYPLAGTARSDREAR